VDGLRAKEALQHIEKVVPPTDFEKSDYPNRPGDRRFEKIVRFASISLTKAGWMVKTKGRWYVTEDGAKAHKQFQDPEQFNLEAKRLYRQWKASQPEELTDLDESELDATSRIDQEAQAISTYTEEVQEAATAQIEKHLENISPYDLQRLVAALLSAMGYNVSYNAPPGPDKGVDIIAHNDPFGAIAPRIKVQVKRRADRIPVGELRSFASLIGANDVGIFVSLGGFTSDAQSEARAKEARITLIDLDELVRLWIEHYDKVAETERRLLPLKPVYLLAFD
jgi:restriction system protein